MDNIRNATLIGYLLLNETNVLCVGPTGSGKTLTITAKLSKSMTKKYICDFITFSARTSANQTQVCYLLLLITNFSIGSTYCWHST